MRDLMPLALPAGPVDAWLRAARDARHGLGHSLGAQAVCALVRVEGLDVEGLDVEGLDVEAWRAVVAELDRKSADAGHVSTGDPPGALTGATWARLQGLVHGVRQARRLADPEAIATRGAEALGDVEDLEPLLRAVLVERLVGALDRARDAATVDRLLEALRRFGPGALETAYAQTLAAPDSDRAAHPVFQAARERLGPRAEGPAGHGARARLESARPWGALEGEQAVAPLPPEAWARFTAWIEEARLAGLESDARAFVAIRFGGLDWQRAADLTAMPWGFLTRSAPATAEPGLGVTGDRARRASGPAGRDTAETSRPEVAEIERVTRAWQAFRPWAAAIRTEGLSRLGVAPGPAPEAGTAAATAATATDPLAPGEAAVQQVLLEALVTQLGRAPDRAPQLLAASRRLNAGAVVVLGRELLRHPELPESVREWAAVCADLELARASLEEPAPARTERTSREAAAGSRASGTAPSGGRGPTGAGRAPRGPGRRGPLPS